MSWWKNIVSAFEKDFEKTIEGNLTSGGYKNVDNNYITGGGNPSTQDLSNQAGQTQRIDIDPALLNRYKQSYGPNDSAYTPKPFDVDLFMNDYYGDQGFMMSGAGNLTVREGDLGLRSLESINADIDSFGGKQLFGGTVKRDPETGMTYVEGGERVPWAQLAGHVGPDRVLSGVSGGKKDFWQELQMLKELRRMGGSSGGAGVDKPPPFVHNWERPAEPQHQRAGDFKWDGRDPHPPAPAQQRAEPYQRDRAKYAKLMGY